MPAYETKSTNDRALVLGGGGVTGIAWMTGILLGLRENGGELLHGVDTIIGTSAGPAVAAQIASDVALDDLFERQVDPARQVAEIAPEPHLLQRLGETFPGLLRLGEPDETHSHPTPGTRRQRLDKRKTAFVPETWPLSWQRS